MKQLVTILLLTLASAFSSAKEAELPSDSVYQIGTQWTDSEGHRLALAKLRGEPVVMTMVYLSCPHTCPMTVAKLKAIESQFQKKNLKDYKIVLVSFDFERDRPDKLKKFMQDRNLSPQHWMMLTGENDEDVRELSIVLGINYKKLDDGDYAHGNVLSLLDGDGRKLAKLDRLSADEGPLVQAMEKNFGGK